MDGVALGKPVKITRSSFSFPLQSIAILLVLFIAAGVYVKFQKGITIVLIIAFLLNLIPVIYLHISYWLKNADNTFILSNHAIVHLHNGAENTYTASDIEKIVIYKSTSMDEGNFPIVPIQQYHYSKVFLRSGEALYLTCLLSRHIDQIIGQIEGVRFERRIQTFNSVHSH